MSRKPVSSVILVLLVMSIIVFAVKIQLVKADGPIYIRADGSIDPPTAPISTLDNVTYALTGNITSSSDGITVERNNLIIDGNQYTVQGPGNSAAEILNGIDLTGRSNVTVKNTKISNFFFGINLLSSSNNIVSRNNITNNDVGIYLLSSGNNISGNSFVNDGLFVDEYSFGNVVSGNVVNGKPLVYLEDASDVVVGDAGQVVLIQCSHIRVENLNLSNATVGVDLWQTNNTEISGNNITENSHWGIRLVSCSDDIISRNNITENSVDGISQYFSSNVSISGNNIAENLAEGIYLGFSSGNIVSGNNITNSDAGISFDSSPSNIVSGNNITNNLDGISIGGSQPVSGNEVYHNNFINNTFSQVSSAQSGSINIWDNGYPSGGNYWSDYNGTDSYSGPYQNVTGSDGIGDTPYVIDVNNIDHYPLMKPWHQIPGDINFDGKVSLADLVLLAKAYGSKPGDSNWDPNADIDGKGVVDLADLVILAQHYGQHVP